MEEVYVQKSQATWKPHYQHALPQNTGQKGRNKGGGPSTAKYPQSSIMLNVVATYHLFASHLQAGHEGSILPPPRVDLCKHVFGDTLPRNMEVLLMCDALLGSLLSIGHLFVVLRSLQD